MSGTAENIAGAPSTGATSSGNITSGTASEAMIKAATAASSAATGSDGKTEDTTTQAGTETGATAAATEQPVSGEKKEQSIPLERHEIALRNAREEARREGMTNALTDYARANGIDPNILASRLKVAAQMADNPKAFWQQLGEELKAAGQGDEADEAYPDPDIVDPTGKLKTYTHETLLKAMEIHGRKVMKQLQKEMRPALEFATTEQERREQAEVSERNRAAAQSVMAEVRQLPNFPKDKAGEAKVLEEWRAIPKETRQVIGPVAALYRAFESYKAKHVYPTLEADVEKRVREDYRKKAVTSAGQAHPVDNGSGDGTKPELKTVSDLSKHMARLAASASA